MPRWVWLLLAAGLAVALFTAVRGWPPRGGPTPTLAPTPSGTGLAGPPRPEPTVPASLPTAEPELDRQLAQGYRKLLEAQGLKITALAITDRRQTGGARRADIVYQTATAGTLKALRAEIARILGAGTSSRLALDIVTVRAVNASGKVVATVSAGIPDIERWLRKQSTDEDFYRAWIVRTPPP
ncbi:MAG: hypothetical protein ACRDGN_06490 [bacterium]